MPRIKGAKEVKVKYEPVDIRLELRVGDAGRLTIPRIIQKSYDLKPGKYVRIRIEAIGEPESQR